MMKNDGQFEANSWGKLLFLGPQAVALIISLLGHFSSWNLIMKLKVICNVIVNFHYLNIHVYLNNWGCV